MSKLIAPSLNTDTFTVTVLKGLDSSRHVKILRKTTNFLSLKDMFPQNFCHLQLNE